MRLECLAKLSWIFYYSRPTLVSAGLEKTLKQVKRMMTAYKKSRKRLNSNANDTWSINCRHIYPCFTTTSQIKNVLTGETVQPLQKKTTTKKKKFYKMGRAWLTKQTHEVRVEIAISDSNFSRCLLGNIEEKWLFFLLIFSVFQCPLT